MATVFKLGAGAEKYTCPYCKTQFKEGDKAISCPACQTLHHASCWEENKGCTTFGCSEQHYEEQHTNPTDVCKQCGTPLGDGQAFCPKCGTPKVEEKKNICGKCGAELQDGQEFCPKCGQKAGLAVDAGVSSAISQFNAGIDKSNEAKKKKPVKIIIAAVIALAVIVAGVLLAPKIFVSVEELCAQGNYEKAYEKASGSEKNDVAVENLAAFYSDYASDNLKDPSSFSLRDAYYNLHEYEGEVTPHLVLYLSGANSYGASVSSYWLFTYDDESGEFEYYTSVSDLSDEETSKYDDTDEIIEKILKNLARDYIKEAMSSGIKLDKGAVKNINNLFEEGTLYEVELLDVDYFSIK